MTRSGAPPEPGGAGGCLPVRSCPAGKAAHPSGGEKREKRGGRSRIKSTSPSGLRDRAEFLKSSRMALPARPCLFWVYEKAFLSIQGASSSKPQKLTNSSLPLCISPGNSSPTPSARPLAKGSAPAHSSWNYTGKGVLRGVQRCRISRQTPPIASWGPATMHVCREPHT